jgi:hypothetical protein
MEKIQVIKVRGVGTEGAGRSVLGQRGAAYGQAVVLLMAVPSIQPVFLC